MLAHPIRGKLFRRGGAIVRFELPSLTEILEFGGRVWKRKNEFHVTLVGRKILRELGVPADAEQAIARAARGLRFEVTMTDDFRLIRDADDATIIQMCSVPAADEFFDRVEAELERSVMRPPYHVTLYTSGTARGIGIYSDADLERMGRRLTAAERDDLIARIGAERPAC